MKVMDGTESAGPGHEAELPAGRSRSMMRRWAPALAVAVLLAAVTAVTATVLARRPPGVATRPASPPSLVVHDGDRVRAFGQLVQSAEGPLLCTHVESPTRGRRPAPARPRPGPAGRSRSRG